METIPRNYGRQHRFDAYCKVVLRNEAKNYLREQARQRNREKSLDALTQAELDKLATVDHYPSDSYVFSSHGYDLLIDNELVADAFARRSAAAIPTAMPLTSTPSSAGIRRYFRPSMIRVSTI